VHSAHSSISGNLGTNSRSVRVFPCAGDMHAHFYTAHSCDVPQRALELPGRQTNSLLPSDEALESLALPQSYGASSGPPPCGAHQRARIQLSSCCRSARAVVCSVFTQHLFGFSSCFLCVGGIVTFVILDRRSRFFTQAWLKAVSRFSELNARLRAEVGHDTDRKLGRLSPRRMLLRHVSLPAAM
jgi:hypothetical protein